MDAVRAEVRRYPEARASKAGLRIGELAGLDVDSLRFCFEAIVQGTELESLQLEIELCPQRRHCGDCARDFAVRDYELRCPYCGSERGECRGGDELDLTFVEVEEHATSGVGTESSR